MKTFIETMQNVHTRWRRCWFFCSSIVIIRFRRVLNSYYTVSNLWVASRHVTRRLVGLPCVRSYMQRRQVKAKKTYSHVQSKSFCWAIKRGPRGWSTKVGAKDTERRGRGREKKVVCERRATRYSPTTRIMHKHEIGPHYRHAAASRLISRHSFCANASRCKC